MKKITVPFIIATCLLGVISCKKDSNTPVTPITPPSSSTLSINSDYQAKYTLNGTAISDVNGGSDFNMYNTVDGSTNPVGFGPSTFIYSCGIGKASNDVGIDIEKGTITLVNGGSPPSDSAFLALFPVGTATFSAGAANGVVISYWDGTTSWRSDLGTADQTGSVFKIVDRKTVASSYYAVKVYATFNCKLYDGAGNSKTITNGSFIGDFEKI